MIMQREPDEKEGKKMNPFDYKIVPEPFAQIR